MSPPIVRLSGFTNAIEDFRRVMSDAGLTHSGEIHSDSKLHRFKADGDDHRNSWYLLHAGAPSAGAFGCWKRGIKQTWCERNGSLSQAEIQRIRQKIQDAEAKAKKET